MTALVQFMRAADVDESKPTPLYLQLQQAIRSAMQSGALKADEALPSERDLARELGISRVTVRKAIAGLVEDGLLVQRWGSGTFMAARMHVEQPLSRLSSFTDDMITRGLVPSARFLHRGLGPVSPKEAMALVALARRDGEPDPAPAPGRRHAHGDRICGGAEPLPARSAGGRELPLCRADPPRLRPAPRAAAPPCRAAERGAGAPC